jgi:conjugal transfer/type IV secretion protein DotA/TraY
MISFFAIASDDQSVFYLTELFGTVGTVLVPNPNGTTFNLMSVIFKSLNTTALIIGAIIVTHTTVMGLIKTAAEGEFLGKQWSSLWVPVRMVLGIAALFPSAAGYSFLQVIMMWVILQGVGAADSLWTVVLNYVGYFGSPYSTVTLPTTVGVQQSIKVLFNDLVCEASMRGENPQTNQVYKNSYTDSQGSHNFYYCADNANSAFCNNKTLGASIADAAGTVSQPSGGSAVSATALSSATSSYCSTNGGTVLCNFGPPFNPTSGACGSMTFGNAAQYCPGGTDLASLSTCAGYTAQQTALAWIIDVLYNTANDLVNLDNQYLTWTQSAANSVQTPQFVQNYCEMASIPESSCLISNSGMPAASSGSNYAASDAVVQNILWPCYIEAVVSGQGNTGACIKGAPSGNVDFISTSVNFYTTGINGAIAQAMMSYLSTSTNTNSTFATAQAMGWIQAGAYYYTIANTNATSTTLTIPPFSATPPPSASSNPVGSYRNNVGAANALVNQINSQTADPSAPTSSIPGFSSMGGGMSDAITQGIWNSFSSALTGSSTGISTNPLVSMASFGHTLTYTAQVIFATVMAIEIPLIILVGYAGAPLVLGSGSASNGALEATKFFVYGLYAILMAFMGWAFSVGGMLGIYTPLIPYIIFISGAVGWFISVIEAMVAAPFVALGILSPSGQHELLGKADAGLMILFGTFLRPTLMIVGMMASMIMAPIVVSLVNSGFKSVMLSINSSPGIYELIVFISAYMSLVLTVLNKAFALIHIVPDRALTWIGGAAGSAGSDAGEATGAAKSATSAAGDAAAGAAKGASDSGAAGVGATQSGRRQDKKEADADMAGKKAEVKADQTSARLLDAVNRKK